MFSFCWLDVGIIGLLFVRIKKNGGMKNEFCDIFLFLR